MNLQHITYQLPDHYETISQAAERLPISQQDAKIYQRLYGLDTIAIDSSVRIEQLGQQVIQRCLETAKVRPEQVKWLVHTHTGNHIAPFMQSPVRQMQRQVGLHAAVAFAMSLAKCASPMSVCELARSLVKDFCATEYLLLITGDVTFTEVLQYIPGTTLNSDGACAMLLGNGKEHQVLSIVNNIHGEFAAGIWASKTEQHEFEKYYAAHLVTAITSAIKQAGLTIDDIAYLFPHNVNRLSWMKVIKHLGLDQNQVYWDNIAKFGHCFGADPFINLATALEQSLLQPRDYYVLATVGLGASFAAMVLQY